MPKTAKKSAPNAKTHALLERAKRDGTPLIEGEHVTFIWQDAPKATPPVLIGDFNGWGNIPDKVITPKAVVKGLWTYSVTLPKNGYFEYFFTPDPTDDQARLNDPLNTHKITNGFGKFNNYFSMPGYQHTPLVKAKKGVPQGTVTHYVLTHGLLPPKGKRDVWLYAPPVDHAVPLLVVYDGKDYLTRAKLPQIVDHLIHDGKIEPIALAMIENAYASRFIEYNASEACLIAVLNLLLPLAKQELNLVDVAAQPGAYGVLGASMGGLMALYTGVRLPSIFGKVISQSGAFQFDLGQHETVLKLLLKTQPPISHLKIWQDVGLYEWLLTTNCEMNKLLTERGYAVTYQEYAGGHNYTSWRNMLPTALMTVFGNG